MYQYHSYHVSYTLFIVPILFLSSAYYLLFAILIIMQHLIPRIFQTLLQNPRKLKGFLVIGFGMVEMFALKISLDFAQVVFFAGYFVYSSFIVHRSSPMYLYLLFLFNSFTFFPFPSPFHIILFFLFYFILML